MHWVDGVVLKLHTIEIIKFVLVRMSWISSVGSVFTRATLVFSTSARLSNFSPVLSCTLVSSNQGEYSRQLVPKLLHSVNECTAKSTKTSQYDIKVSQCCVFWKIINLVTKQSPPTDNSSHPHQLQCRVSCSMPRLWNKFTAFGHKCISLVCFLVFIVLLYALR